MYSLHGLLALIRPDCGHVCHSLIVSSNCTPGSAHRHAAYPTCFHKCRAFIVLCTFPSFRRVVLQSASSSTAFKKRLGTRTELFEFCPLTVAYPSPLKS